MLVACIGLSSAIVGQAEVIDFMVQEQEQEQE
jgi:hypothetical protein